MLETELGSSARAAGDLDCWASLQPWDMKIWSGITLVMLEIMYIIQRIDKKSIRFIGWLITVTLVPGDLSFLHGHLHTQVNKHTQTHRHTHPRPYLPQLKYLTFLLFFRCLEITSPVSLASYMWDPIWAISLLNSSVGADLAFKDLPILLHSELEFSKAKKSTSNFQDQDCLCSNTGSQDSKQVFEMEEIMIVELECGMLSHVSTAWLCARGSSWRMSWRSTNSGRSQAAHFIGFSSVNDVRFKRFVPDMEQCRLRSPHSTLPKVLQHLPSLLTPSPSLVGEKGA